MGDKGMKRSAYKKAWSVITIAMVMVVFGIMHQPLVAILGVTVMGTSMLASSMERKNRKYEEMLGEKVYESSYAAEQIPEYMPHRAV